MPSVQVTMAEALSGVGWDRPAPVVTAGGTGSGGGVEVFGHEARLALRIGTQQNSSLRPLDQPVPTIPFGHDAAEAKWVLRHNSADHKRPRDDDGVQRARADDGTDHYYRFPDDKPAPVVSTQAKDWVWERPDGAVVYTDANTEGPDGLRRYSRDVQRPAPVVDTKVNRWWVDQPAWTRARPATTVVGSYRLDVISPPGHSDRSPNGKPRQNRDGAVRITVEQAAILQGFDPDYPWQGSRTARFRLVGNACPPPLAAAVCAPLVDS